MVNWYCEVGLHHIFLDLVKQKMALLHFFEILVNCYHERLLWINVSVFYGLVTFLGHCN